MFFNSFVGKVVGFFVLGMAGKFGWKTGDTLAEEFKVWCESRRKKCCKTEETEVDCCESTDCK